MIADEESESSDDDDTLRAKRAKRAMMRPAEKSSQAVSRLALHTAVPPTPIGHEDAPPLETEGPAVSRSCATPDFCPADASLRSAASPSMCWNSSAGGVKVRAGDIGVSLPAPPSECDSAYRMLLIQNAAIQAEIAKLSQQHISLQSMFMHVARELALVHKHPPLIPDPATMYNPYTDQAGRPGPMDEAPSRGLDPRELAWLHTQVEQLSKSNQDRCDGFRRIVDPLGWYQNKVIDVPIVDLDWHKQWQLYHYAYGEPETTPLSSVLSPEEMEFSSEKKQTHAASSDRPLLHEDTYRRQQFDRLSTELNIVRMQSCADGEVGR